jgi:hypothetical protein
MVETMKAAPAPTIAPMMPPPTAAEATPPATHWGLVGPDSTAARASSDDLRGEEGGGLSRPPPHITA